MHAEGPDSDRLRTAANRIAGHAVRTPLRRVGETGLWVKCENQQRTGSFKLRGALNKILALPASALRNGVVAASAGNHGQGVAYAARLRAATAVIVVPHDAVQAKVSAIRELGADVRWVVGGYAAAEEEGRRLACQTGAVWVSPYNDADVIAGQGTVGLEMAEQLDFDERTAGWEVYVPVGGGGLVCGIGLALRSVAPLVRVIGVQPEASSYLHAYYHGSDPSTVVEEPTLADGLAGALEPDSITYRLLPQVVDGMLLVSEEAIRKAIIWAWREAGEVIEPSAAAALAAALQPKVEARRLIVLSGGNIDPGLRAQLGIEARRDV